MTAVVRDPSRQRSDGSLARLRVLVLAYMVSPYRGSEYSVAWNHITHMAEVCDLTVLYGAAGPHMGDTAELEEHLQRHPVPHVRFIAVAPGGAAQWLNTANRHGWLTYTFYLAYRLWHRRVYEVAADLVRQERFDLVHYLGPIGYREPGYLWRLGLPYVWGPIGGATNVPRQLLGALPMAGRFKLRLRAVVNWFQLRCSRRVGYALANTDVLLTATTENQDIFRRIRHKESLYLPENGINGGIALDRTKFAVLDPIALIWIGSVEARKALKILVNALSKARRPDRFLVHVVGDGPLRAGLQAQAIELGLEASFVWHGQVPRDVVRRLLSVSHLHVVTSLSEGNPTTIWEAMSCGVPTMTLDHCGMRDIVTSASGVKVPLGDYAQVVDGFARELDELAEQPERLVAMAESVLKEAPRHHCDHRVPYFLSRYADALKLRHGRPASMCAVALAAHPGRDA